MHRHRTSRVAAFRLSLSMYFTESQDINHDALSVIRMYYGEKIAFFYAWITHLTAYLMLISPIGVGLWLYHTIIGVNKSSWVLPYTLIIIVWGTVQHKYWKRKQTELAYLWNVREVAMNEMTRPGFRGDDGVEPVTGYVEKMDDPRARLLKQFLYFPSYFVWCLSLLSRLWPFAYFSITWANNQAEILQSIEDCLR